MLFIRANTLFNIRTPSIRLISPSVLHPSDITIRPSSYPYVPACTLAPVAFYPSFCQLMHKQPPAHYSSIPALVPGGAMCTAGMAMLGSAFLQPTGYMLHVSKCSIVIDFCTKPCRAGLFSISAMSVRKFPFWDKFHTCSTQRLGTAFRLIGPGAPLFLPQPICLSAYPPGCPPYQLCPDSHNSIHPAIHQIHLGLPIHPHPHSTVHNSIQTLTISVYHFCLGSVALSIHPTTPSGLRATPFTFLPFFGQTFGTPTCVCPSPMDNILSDWAWSPFIPTMTHLLAFVPFPVHPPICLPTLATPNSIRLAQILWVIHPYTLSYTLDTHCHPMAPSTQSPTIHIRRLKGHSIGLIAKPIQSMSPMLPKVAHGGLNFSWWYDKISYAPVLSAVSPFRRQAKSDFRWPIGHFCSTG